MILNPEFEKAVLEQNYDQIIQMAPHTFPWDISQAVLEAVEMNDIRLVQLLIQLGADLAVLGSDVFEFPIQNGNIAMVRALLEGGADPLADGGEAFLLAIEGHQNNLLKFLLDTTEITDVEFLEMLMNTSVVQKNRVAVKLLRAMGASLSNERVMASLCAYPDKEMIDFALAQGVNFHTSGVCIQSAILHNQYGMVYFLLQRNQIPPFRIKQFMEMTHDPKMKQILVSFLEEN